MSLDFCILESTLMYHAVAASHNEKTLTIDVLSPFSFLFYRFCVYYKNTIERAKRNLSLKLVYFSIFLGFHVEEPKID